MRPACATVARDGRNSTSRRYYLSSARLSAEAFARPDISIRRKRKRGGWSDAFARSILGQMR